MEELEQLETEQINDATMEQSRSSDENMGSDISSGESASGEYNGQDIARDIIKEARSLYNTEKEDILVPLVESRIGQTKKKYQLRVLQCALERSAAKKTQLQLELACNNRVLLGIQDMVKHQAEVFEAMTCKYKTVINKIGKLDVDRVQLIKTTRAMLSGATKVLQEIEEIQREDLEQSACSQLELERRNNLQANIDELLTSNNHLERRLVETKESRQVLTSSHSERLNAIETSSGRLNEQLRETNQQIACSEATNAKLKEITDTRLTEKTQFSTVLEKMENERIELEAEIQKIADNAEQIWKTKFEEETQAVKFKWNETGERFEKTNAEMTQLKETIEKLYSELDEWKKNIEQKRTCANETKGIVERMQIILDERNNEIFSLHAMMNNEQKRFDEQMQQLQQEIKGFKEQTENCCEQSERDDLKIQQLENDLAQLVSKITAAESILNQKIEQSRVLQEKVTVGEQTQARIAELELALADQTTKAVTLEEQLQDKGNNIRSGLSVTTIAGQATAQVTSTPLRPIDLNVSPDVTPSKRIRINDSDEASHPPSGSNYSIFQNSVNRKRAPTSFFPRKSPVYLQQIQPTSVTHSKSFFGSSRRHRSTEELDLSLASTINLSEVALEASNTSGGSSVRLVKPFFRKQQNK